MSIIEINPIPNRLRMSRRSSGLTQIAVAKKLGLQSTVRISRWEKGLSVPNLKNLLKLSLLYEVMPYDLYPDYVAELSKELSIETSDFIPENPYINFDNEFS